MQSHKYTGLIGIVLSVVLLFLAIGYQDLFTKQSLALLIIIILYLGILSWQYVFYGNWRNSAIPALKITLIVGGISLVIGLLKKFLA